MPRLRFFATEVSRAQERLIRSTLVDVFGRVIQMSDPQGQEIVQFLPLPDVDDGFESFAYSPIDCVLEIGGCELTQGEKKDLAQQLVFRLVEVMKPSPTPIFAQVFGLADVPPSIRVEFRDCEKRAVESSGQFEGGGGLTLRQNA